jgi:hypothetical protein
MAIVLRPNALDFRQVYVGGAVTLPLIAFNNSGSPETINSVLIGAGTVFTLKLSESYPFSVAAYDTFVIFVTYTPLVVMAGDTDTITLNYGTGAGTDVTCSCTGGADDDTVALMSVNPPSWNFTQVETVYQGSYSGAIQIQLISSGNQTLTISDIVAHAPFKLVEPLPVLPRDLAPGDAMTIWVVFYPAVTTAYNQAGLTIYNNSPWSPNGEDIVLAGTATAVTSVNTITGTPLILLALGSTIDNAHSNSLVCEEPAQLVRQHNMGLSGVEKTLKEIRLKYEDLGLATLYLRVKTTSGTKQAIWSIGTTDADAWIREASAQLQVEGETLELTISQTAGGGAVSIIEYTLGFDDWSELSVLSGLAAVSSANSVTGTILPLFALGGAVYNAHNDSLICEEPALLKRQHNMGVALLEKTTVGVRFKYEDFGILTLRVLAKTVNGQASSSVSIGTAAADGTIREGYVSFAVEGEIVELNFIPTSGALSIIEYDLTYDDWTELSVLKLLAAVSSANTITGTPLPLFALGGAVYQGAAQVACEEPTLLKRLHNMGTPLVEKTLTGVRFKYEDFGLATVSVIAKTVNGQAQSTVSIGTLAADGTVREAFAVVTEEGELLELNFAPLTGFVSIIEYDLTYDDWSEFSVEKLLPAVTSAYSVTGTPLPMLALGPYLRRADPSNLDCEEPGLIKRLSNLQASGVEKSLVSARVKYEDLGVATLLARAVTKRGSSLQSMSLGSAGADTSIKQGFADMALEDELIELTFSRSASSGPVSLVEYTEVFADRGEVIKAT